MRRLILGVAVAAYGVIPPSLACGISKESIAMTIAGTSSHGPSASRQPPPDVPPVVLDGIRYGQRAGKEAEDGQVGGLLAAYDANGRLLWTLKVYDNRRQPHLEGDVQDVFFSSMTAEPDGRLRIVDETSRQFLVDVKTRTVTALPPVRKRTDDGGIW